MDLGLVVSIALAIIFFIISTVLALKLTQKRRPSWAYLTEKIMGTGTDTPPELQIFFNGHPVTDVNGQPVTDIFRTFFILFNRGNKVIRSGFDVSRTIYLHLTGANILREPIVRPRNEEIKFSARKVELDKDSLIELNFSYLDHNDGAVLEVLHTQYSKINCTGNIIEAGEPRYIGEFIPYKYKFTRSRILLYVFFVLGPLVLDGFFWLVDMRDTKAFNIWNYVVLPLAVWVMFLFQILPGIIKRLRFPSWSRIQPS